MTAHIIKTLNFNQDRMSNAITTESPMLHFMIAITYLL